VSSSENKVKRLLFMQRSAQPDIYNLYDSLTSAEPFAIAGIQTLQRSKDMRKLFDEKANTYRILMECEYEANLMKWVPVRKSSARKI
jgi:hypothetical protein